MIASFDGDIVYLGNRYERSPEVRLGETWRCYVWLTSSAKIAEPLHRVDPPPEPPSPPALPAAPPPSAEPPAEPVAPAPTGPDRAGAARIEEAPTEAADPPPDLGLVSLVDPADAEEDWLPVATLEGLAGESIALLAHGPETDEALHELNLTARWNKVIHFFLADARFEGAFWHDADDGDPQRRRFYEQLASWHWTVRPHPPRAQTEKERTEAREQLDIEFALDAAYTAGRASVIILFAYSAKFLPILRNLQRRGKRVFVVTTRNLISPALAEAADKPLFFLEDIKDQIKGGGRSGK